MRTDANLLPEVPLILNALVAAALAQNPSAPLVPAASVAMEDGPLAHWINPAHLAYDRDPRGALLLRQPFANGDRWLAGTAGIRGVSFGAWGVSRADGGTRWALDGSASLELPERLAIGIRTAWHASPSLNNYVSVDGGASWRPLPWMGVSMALRNLGSPDPGAPAQTVAGFAVRPFRDLLTIGFDAQRSYGEAPSDRLSLVTRIRPAEGVFLRGAVFSDRVGDQDLVGAAGGIEVHFGGVGAGALTSFGQEGSSLSALLTSTERDERAVRLGGDVVSATLQRDPYEPEVPLFGAPERSWLATLELLRQVEQRKRPQTVVLVLGQQPMELPRYEEVADRVRGLVRGGHEVWVYMDGTPDDGAFMVAAEASRVVLNPTAELRFDGLFTELTFMAEAMAWLGVQPQFVWRGPYKSAVEQWLRAGPSQANIEQMQALLDDQTRTVVQRVAEGRGVSEERVSQWMAGGPWTASEASALGLVDSVAYLDEVPSMVEAAFGKPARWRNLDDIPQPEKPWEKANRIAVLYVEGVLTRGSSPEPGLLDPAATGSDTLAQQLLEVSRDPSVRAVVLRVDSPGGSASAADQVHRALTLVQREGKPVVVSMGTVAASGGYYMAAGADRIFAQQTTVTGSIGVYAGRFALGPMAENLGVFSHTVQSGRNASIDATFVPWDAVQRARMQSLVDGAYERFTRLVSEGRSLTAEETEAAAGGRLWSGQRAVDLGLVDEIGGLPEAIRAAHALAGLPERQRINLVTWDSAVLRMPGLGPVQLRARVSPTLPPSLETAIRHAAMGLHLSSQGDSVWLLDPRFMGTTP